MGARELRDLLSTSAASINDTLSLLSKPAVAGGKSTAWKDVIIAAESVSKHATTTGMLWGGNVQKNEGSQNIQSFFEALHFFILLCHGSTVGAGPTLLKTVDLAARCVVDASLELLRVAVTFPGQGNKREELDLPVLVGRVWEACEAVKKSPTNNCVAIGRSLTQVAVSVKDVLRELSEFKEDSTVKEIVEVTNGELDGDASVHVDELKGSTCCNEGDLQENVEDLHSGEDSAVISEELSAKEMQVVQSVKDLVSSILTVLKQLLHIVIGMSRESEDAMNRTVVVSLERILKLSKDVGVGVDELGASLYPPQEIEMLQARSEEIEILLDSLQSEVLAVKGVIPKDFVLALSTSKDAGIALRKVLDSCNEIAC